MFKFPEQMKRVFKDDEMQAHFEEYGYVTASFYDQDDINELEDLFYRFHKKDDLKGFFSSTFSSNKEYRIIADQSIRRINSRSIDRLLKDVKVVCGSFIVKAPDDNSGMSVHQDMTLIDESEFTGINIWCPLTDLTEDNGVLMVLEKSHRLYPTYRGSSIPGIYEEVCDDLIKLMKPVYLTAGEAIFFDQSIIHYSPPNHSDEPRIVTNTYFSHKDVRFVTAYLNPDQSDKIELFEQDERFMTDFEQFGQNIKDRPKVGKSLGFYDYDFPKITKQDLLDNYGYQIVEDVPQKAIKQSLVTSLLKRFKIR
ncbi:MAG: phytanoyl-CoA dioxygenase family protein [Chitinophagales bacterium]